MHPYANRNTTSGTQQAAQALRTALANPYQYSSHYSQAYSSQQAPGSTSEGYAYSSTYAHSLPIRPQQSSVSRPPPRGSHTPHQSRDGGNRGINQRGQQQQTHWYEPGDHKCRYEGCMFTGAKKSVEIHMMDRHLIYPPGWDKRKRKREWDADPSLLKSGKPIPIQGTSLVLDTPEAIEAWIAERRKRWPTTAHVDEKEKKLKDAIERGEITATESTLRGRKRPRTDDGHRGDGLARGKRRGRDDNKEGVQVPRTIHPLPAKPVAAMSVTANVSEDESSSSGSDIDPEKDAISSKAPLSFVESLEEEEAVSKMKKEEKTLQDTRPQPVRPVPRRPAPKPRMPKKNPFANRPSLFHNLLLPEIRMTVSNLSQAIHFLVENDFLQDVELNPGDAENKPIEIISETSHETTQVQ